MKSKIITLSAISCGLIAIILSFGAYIQVADIFSLLVVSLVVLLPLFYNSVKGALLTYFVGGIVSLLFCLPTFLFSFVIPAYFCFFGIFPVVYCVTDSKSINKFLRYFIGMFWCVLFFYGLYFYYTLVMGLELSNIPSLISNGILYFIAPFSIVFYCIYERFIYFGKNYVFRLLQRVIK